MRAAALAAGIVLAVCLTVPAVSGPNDPNIKAHATTASSKKRVEQPLKHPTWEQCYAMSRQRGFDHELDEWLQSTVDCQDGKIPL